jgi:hypothetical protein
MKNIWQAIDKIKHDLERGKKWCEVCQLRERVEDEKKDICHLITGIKRIETTLFKLIEELEKIENEN